MAGEGRELRFGSGGRVGVERFEFQPPGRRQLLVRVLKTQVSAGTELRTLENDSTGKGITLGYMQSGVIEAVGEGIEDFVVGMRVVTYGPHRSHWLVDLDDSSVVGIPRYIEPIPDGVCDSAAGFAVLGDVALHALRRARLVLDQTVAVIGAGMLGQLTAQLARAAGASRVVVVDPVAERTAAAVACGATDGAEASDHVRALVPGGVDISVVCAPTPAAVQDAIAMCADRGTVALAAITGAESAVRSADIVAKELTIVGVHETGLAEAHWYWQWSPERNRRTCLDLMRRGELEVERLLTHEVPYTNAPAILEMMLDPSRAHEWLGVVFSWEDLTCDS